MERDWECSLCTQLGAIRHRGTDGCDAWRVRGRHSVVRRRGDYTCAIQMRVPRRSHRRMRWPYTHVSPIQPDLVIVKVPRVAGEAR